MSLKPPSLPDPKQNRSSHLPPSPPPSPSSYYQSYAVLRAGLVGGATLGIALAGQRMATSPEMSILGWFIVIFGLFCVGYFAVRDVLSHTHANDPADASALTKPASPFKRRRDAVRLGLVSGLIAGVVIGLAFVVINLVLSLDAEQLQMMREGALENMRQWSPEQAQVLQNSPAELDSMVRLSYGIATGCCGLILPIMGMLLSAFGALSASPQSPKPTPQ